MLSLAVLGCHTIVIHYSRVSHDRIIAASAVEKSVTMRAHVGSMPACLAVNAVGESICPSSSFNMISVPQL